MMRQDASVPCSEAGERFPAVICCIMSIWTASVREWIAGQDQQNASTTACNMTAVHKGASSTRTSADIKRSHLVGDQSFAKPPYPGRAHEPYSQCSPLCFSSHRLSSVRSRPRTTRTRRLSSRTTCTSALALAARRRLQRVAQAALLAPAASKLLAD